MQTCMHISDEKGGCGERVCSKIEYYILWILDTIFHLRTHPLSYRIWYISHRRIPYPVEETHILLILRQPCAAYAIFARETALSSGPSDVSIMPYSTTD